jgi:hypothetical protein
MSKVVVSEEAIRQMVREAISGTGWSNEDAGEANVNPVVDPSVAVTDPINPDFAPQDKTEMGIAVGQLVKNLPDTEMPAIYQMFKQSLDQRTEKEEASEAEKVALQGGSQEAIDDMEKQKSEGAVPTAKGLEEAVRKQIRAQLKALMEAGELPPVKKIPYGTHGGEYERRHQKSRNDLKQWLKGPIEDPAAEDAGEEEEPGRRRAYKATALGSMADVSGKSFEEIAKELGFSVAGAKQAVDKAIEKARFLGGLEEDDREILILTAMNDYVKMLQKSGELTGADVQLMKDHPDIVRELDGFREFLHNTVRRARKSGQKVEDPLGEADEALDEADPTSISMDSVADTKHPQAKPSSSAGSSATTKATGASGKGIQVDWGGMDEGRGTMRGMKAKKSKGVLAEAVATVMQDNRGPYVIADGVEARPSNPNRTQYRAGSSVRVNRYGKKGTYIVEMPNGEQWSNKRLSEAKLTFRQLQKLRPVAFKELMDMEGGEEAQIIQKGGKLFALTPVHNYVWRGETEMWDMYGKELEQFQS